MWTLRERRLGSRLEHQLAGAGVVLHSRHAEPTLDCDPIDHLVVLPAGVWVIAADHDLDRFSVEATTAAVKRLELQVRKQAAACREVISAIGFDWLEVHTAVCATNATGLHRRSVDIDGIWMTRPAGLVTLLAQPGPLSHLDVATVAAELSRRFPAAR